MSELPAHREESLTLDVPGFGSSLRVRVVESNPVMVDGSVRHRLRLAVVD